MMTRRDLVKGSVPSNFVRPQPETSDNESYATMITVSILDR